MKIFALIAAAGSLAAITAPANAADFTPAIGVASHVSHDTTVSYGDPPRHARAYGRRDRDRYYDDRDDDYRDRDRHYDDRDDDYRDRDRYYRGRDRDYRDQRRYERRVYDDRGRYYEPRRLSRRDRVWRGRDGQYYCQRDNGTTGLVIGAGLGALAGRAVDTRGDRSLGTVLGAIAGGLLGREVDRGEVRCR